MNDAGAKDSAQDANVWLTSADDVTQHFSLGEDPMTLGNDRACDVVCGDLEENHLRMWTKAGRVWVQSGGSPRSTRLDGTPMATGIAMLLHPGATLVAGDVVIRASSSTTAGVRVRVDLDGGPAWERVVESLDFNVGRSRDCDVVLPRERVSREHARVVFREGRLWIIDLHSATGTSVNRERIHAPVELAPGDVVGIDGVRMVMTLSAARSANPFDDDEPPAWVFEGDANDRLPTLSDGLPVDDKPVESAWGFSIELSFAGRTLGIYEVVDDVVVGRADDCSLAIDTPALSLRHARFVVEAGALSVLDLGSSRGTYVNGRRVDHTVVLDGDRVELGPVTFVVGRVKPQSPSALGGLLASLDNDEPPSGGAAANKRAPSSQGSPSKSESPAPDNKKTSLTKVSPLVRHVDPTAEGSPETETIRSANLATHLPTQGEAPHDKITTQRTVEDE